MENRAAPSANPATTLPENAAASFRQKLLAGRFFSGAAILLLVLMALLADGAARRESATIDEVVHIGAGLSYWQQLDLRLNQEHPPLGKLIAALPLALRGTKADYSSISWKLGDQFVGGYVAEWIFGARVLQHWNDYPSTLWWARLPMLGLTLLLGWTIFRVGARLGGGWGGLLALTAFVTTPTFLAFGPLVLTDIPITLFVLLTLWSMGELWHSPTHKNVLIFAVWLAAALLSKFSALIIFAVLPTFAVSLRFWPVEGQLADGGDRKRWRQLRSHAAWRGIGWALVITYAFYFLFSIRQPTDTLYFLGQNPIALIARRALLPFAVFLRGLAWLAITASRPTFLLGHHYSHGVWFYFPVAFALKSSLGFLLLLTMALFIWAWRRRNSERTVVPQHLALHWRALWVGFWVFTVVCLLSRLTISIRHFTFSIVLLTVFLSVLPKLIAELKPTARYGLLAVTVVLALSCVVAAIGSYPNYFPYMNSLRFGRPAYLLLSDSNVDWNQALPQAAEWSREHHIEKIGVDEYGLTDPAESVPGGYLWDCQQPNADEAGQWEIISADEILDAHNCAWLLTYQHEPIAGGSMYAVKLPNPIPAAGSPGGPPAPGQARAWLGLPGDSRAQFIAMAHNPERIPEFIAETQKLFREEMQKRGRH